MQERKNKESAHIKDDLAEFRRFDEDDLIDFYFKEIGKTPLLTAEEEVELAKKIEKGKIAEEKKEKLARNGKLTQKNREKVERHIVEGLEAFDHMLKANRRLVVNIAAKYRSGMGKSTFLDLIQDGNIGLIKAINKFDYKRGNKFSTYATWWIRQTICRGISDNYETIRVPLYLHETIRWYSYTVSKVTQVYGRKPTRVEMAEVLVKRYEEKNGIEPDEKKRKRKFERALVKIDNIESALRRGPASLDKPVQRKQFQDDSNDEALEDLIPDETNIVEETENRMLRKELERILEDLPSREARIIRMRNGLLDGKIYSLEEIGKMYGLTRQRVKQLEDKGLERINRHKDKPKLESFL